MAKNEAKVNNKENKNKKSFFKGFKAELKKVIWPTPKQLVNNTTAVIVIVLITAAIVFALDLAFETVNEHGINKVKEIIEASNSVSDEITEDTVESEDGVEVEDEETSTEEQGQEDETQSDEETDAENTVE